ncbi:MAG: hypothetical protein ACKO1N_07835 [Erythrobacter sp.]
MRLFSSTLILAIPLAIAACSGSGGPPKPNKRQVAMINKVLTGAPGSAQPSTIVAAELAFSRAARKQGQWTAFRQFAAPGALLHGGSGPFLIEPWLATQTDPPEAVQWEARTVVMSCDGALAVSKGRYRNPNGTVGGFVTVWERQPDNSYRYIYDAGGDDVPQPPPRKAVEPGDIVVTELDTVQGLVATCPRPGAPPPPPPALAIGEQGKEDARLSRDGTLRWRWEHRADGTRFAAADYFYQGRWVTPIELGLVPTGN